MLVLLSLVGGKTEMVLLLPCVLRGGSSLALLSSGGDGAVLF